MLCEKCKKNEATVHVTQVINGKKTEKHLCESCARESGDAISFKDIFQGLLNITEGHDKWIESEEDSVDTCKNCGLTYDEFRHTGFLGCGECYNAFRHKLDPTIKSIHASNEHKGRIPRRSGGNMLIKREKEELKRKLLRAIDKEDFEEAARLRDKIRELKGGKSDDSKKQA